MDNRHRFSSVNFRELTSFPVSGWRLRTRGTSLETHICKKTGRVYAYFGNWGDGLGLALSYDGQAGLTLPRPYTGLNLGKYPLEMYFVGNSRLRP